MPLKFNQATPNNWGTLNQISQRYPSLFSFARKSGNLVTSLHPGVLCRDYLLDQLAWMREVVYEDKIYGFGEVPQVNPTFPEFFISNCVKHLPDNLEWLNTIETKLGISLTTIEPVNGGFYVRGDPWWYKTTLHLSWYTQALRQMGAVKINGPMKDSADGTFSRMGPVLDVFPFILKETGYDVMIQPKSTDKQTLHDGSGMYQIFLYACQFGYSFEDASKHYNWTENLYKAVKNAYS